MQFLWCGMYGEEVCPTLAQTYNWLSFTSHMGITTSMQLERQEPILWFKFMADTVIHSESKCLLSGNPNPIESMREVIGRASTCWLVCAYLSKVRTIMCIHHFLTFHQIASDRSSGSICVTAGGKGCDNISRHTSIHCENASLEIKSSGRQNCMRQ